MKYIVMAALAVGLLACNSKSPETNDAPEVGVEAPKETAPEEPAKPEELKLPEALPALEGDYFGVYDLLHNRPNAHRQVLGDASGTLVTAGTPDFVRYVHGNHGNEWSLELEVDGEPATAMKKTRKAKMWLPANPGAKSVQVRVLSKKKPNKLSLVINGQKTEEQELADGWQTVTFATEPQRADNEVEFVFTGMGRIAGALSGGAVSWIRLGDGEGFEAPTEAQTQLPLSQDALTLGPDALYWHIWALPNSKLDLEIEGKPGCGVKAVVAGEDGQGVKELGTTERLLVDQRGDSQSTFVELGATEKVVRVTLSKAGACESVTLKRAQLVIPGKKPERPTFDPPKYVVFWMIDTLRADYLPIHHETDVRAPNLKRLADEGASFEVAYVQGNESKTSHASLFSAMFPVKHRVLGRGHLKPFHYLMPEAIHDAGYTTAAYISNGYVSEPWGFVQGWDMYENPLRKKEAFNAPSMTRRGLAWAKNNTEKPFFLYLGTVDPHVTYRRHEELIGNYQKTPYSGRFSKACYGQDLGGIKGGKIKVNDADKERIINLYKNEVEFNDIHFGKLREGLEELGIWDKTMVVVTADHGDEFWEHGSVGHGHSVMHHQVHVPLLVYYPPAIKAKTVVKSGADIADVYPTIVDMLGKERPKDLQGKSQFPAIYGANGGYPEPATATKYLLQYGMQMHQWKVVQRKGDFRLYDRANDHAEQTDVKDKHPLVSRWMMDSLSWFRAHREEWDKTTYGVGSNLPPNFPPLSGKKKEN